MSDNFELFGDQDPDYQISSDLRPIFLGISFAITILPIWLYYTVFDLSFESYALVYLLVTVFSAGILSFGYNNVALWLKSRLMKKRESLKAKEKALKKNTSGPKKTDTAEQKSSHEKKEQDTERESVAFSILFNNVFFLLSVIVLAFYVFDSASAPYNYVISISSSAALCALVSAVTLDS
eukprot:TRINITY_DN8833_c0_g1_i1.p1 TRINITY_DN8833_c0_g1~~TRINITY_DN8833_c0_g1_i1.p1  ORF type:complete len:197 (+),score=38.05 TRINITY_DN8833_c0_g1_i1:52-591(+)